MSVPASARRIATRVLQMLGATLAVFLMCLPLFSQGSQGTIQGGVFDQSGGVLPGATVTVTDVARGATRTLTTDSAGAYIATSLIPGMYTVKAEAKGFQNVEHANVQVEVGQNVRVDLTLQPGAQTQTITVTSEAPAVNTTDATLGGTVSNAEILALPLNGRNFERLLQLRP
jgi:Carboxypeptidase regulatory-like domain